MKEKNNRTAIGIVSIIGIIVVVFFVMFYQDRSGYQGCLKEVEVKYPAVNKDCNAENACKSLTEVFCCRPQTDIYKSQREAAMKTCKTKFHQEYMNE